MLKAIENMINDPIKRHPIAKLGQEIENQKKVLGNQRSIIFTD